MKELTKHIRYFVLFSIIGIIVGYLSLFYKGYTLDLDIAAKRNEIAAKSKEITDKKNECNLLDMQIFEKKNQIKELENNLLKITSTSKDLNTVKQGEKLAISLGIPQGNFFKVTSSKDASQENAKKFEELGYESLFNKDVNASIDAFIKSENSFNSYHQVYEIVKYLVKNKSTLLDKNSSYWKVAYQTILSQYDWKMPEKYKIKLQDQVK